MAGRVGKEFGRDRNHIRMGAALSHSMAAVELNLGIAVAGHRVLASFDSSERFMLIRSMSGWGSSSCFVSREMTTFPSRARYYSDVDGYPDYPPADMNLSEVPEDHDPRRLSTCSSVDVLVIRMEAWAPESLILRSSCPILNSVWL